MECEGISASNIVYVNIFVLLMHSGKMILEVKS